MIGEKLPLSHIEISKQNLIHNIKQFKSLLGRNTKLTAVLKANAYGHGLVEVAQIANLYVDCFQVNSLEELTVLRRVSKKKTFILGYVQDRDLTLAIKLGCILAVFSIDRLEKINNIASKLKIKQEVHIALDAHLGREGFLPNEIKNVLEKIKLYKNINLTGMYAHFANIEDTSDFSHAQKQISEYQKALEVARGLDFGKIQTHISATSGILIYEKSKDLNTFVRLGLGMYGLWPSEHLKSVYSKNKNFKLKPILAWKTKIAQVKSLPKGSTIGYGLTYKTKKDTKVAIIPQGYSDGLDRGFSNNGEVLIRGTKCQILGRVMMNMTVVDVSHLKDVVIEDEVVILGEQGKLRITAEHMAKRIDSINYEIVTRISSLSQRVVI